MRLRGFLLTCLAVLVSGPAMAQKMFKCADGRSFTYSNTPCEKLGLRSAGEVKDRVTTLPAGGPTGTRDPGTTPKKPPAARSENEIDMPKTSTLKPVNPLIEKLIK